MLQNEYNQIFRENFDYSDNYTRQFIARAAVTEDGNDQLLNALSASLYDSIVSKVDEIDFGTIPLSRGDITKVEGFGKTMECLRIIRELVLQYKQDVTAVDVVLSAIQNTMDRKALFIKGYALNAELPMLLYNLIVLAIERSTSLMIATCIQFISDPSSNTPKKALDKVAYQRTMDDVMFQQLGSYNAMCNKKTIDKILDNSMKAVKEDVEFEYDVVAPIDDNDPSTIADPFDNNVDPFGSDEQTPTADPLPDEIRDAQASSIPDNTLNDVEPSNNEPFATIGTDEEVGQQDPSTFEKDQDAAIPAEEDAPVDNNIPTGASDPVQPTPADVEPENIPSVVPGEEISSTDAPINEDELQEGTIGTLGKVVDTVNNAINKITPEGKARTAVKIAGALVGAIFAVKGISALVTKVFIPFIRNLIYGFWYTDLKFADYLEIQAELIESNANEVENSTTMDDATKKKVAEKQRKQAAKLRKWANIVNLDKKKTSNSVKKQNEDDKKNKKKIAKDEDGDDALF